MGHFVTNQQTTNKHECIITLPADVVAKYCDELVCLWVCLSVHEDISRTTRNLY